MNATILQIKERPILFSGPMVRAILDGRKTQTRRIVKTDLRPQSKDTVMRGFPPEPKNVRMLFCYAKCDAPDGSRSVSYRVPCPYGLLGDQLWVKETTSEPGGTVHYRADLNVDHSEVFHWAPSIFCRRDLSRINLEITMVRVERLNDISEEDARAEGVSMPDSVVLDDSVHGSRAWVEAYRDTLWESINGAGSWELNPWVWVIKFRRVTT